MLERDSDAKKCMYINSTNAGLHHPSIKSLVSAKKFWFFAVAHGALQILNSNNLVNLKQNFKNVVKWTGAQMGSIDE